MKTLADPVTLGTLALRSRIIRSATFESANGADNRFAAALIPIYGALTKGSVGAIISGMVGVDENSRVRPSMVAAYDDAFVPEMKAAADSVRAGGAKLVVQLSHCGQKAAPDDGGAPLAPSENEVSPGVVSRAMSRDDIAAVARAFASAAGRCKEAGADAVQIHAAHGYLLSQFLSPHFNSRTDEYGGSIENRARIVFEVYDAIREAVGREYPVWIKINCKDLTEHSLTPEESRWTCGELARRGLDAVEVSGGVAVSPKSGSAQVVRNEDEEGCFAPEALALADSVSIPVISVCGYRTPTRIEDWLNRGAIAAVSLCRPLISEPGLVARWLGGDRTKARCISCNKCFRPKNGFGCQVF